MRNENENEKKKKTYSGLLADQARFRVVRRASFERLRDTLLVDRVERAHLRLILPSSEQAFGWWWCCETSARFRGIIVCTTCRPSLRSVASRGRVSFVSDP